MTFLVKFMVKGILVLALEAGETISEIATHIVSPAKIGYRVATHIDFSSSEENDTVKPKTEPVIRSRFTQSKTVSEI
jgi:flagellar biosynthesis/type III secretory pathway M-ring protein FliF/YscJ